ncbi:DMT family transporter [Maritalea porphyrae]|uniref:aromatic amino acid exporter YddG n=1 Tax=Maritalea porphyrae TaxID=880732 RepID=UPI0022AEE1D1|nr:EamA family transporter [Maritalea porphyrae]MCZ4274055.1 EamA family transporter [Maritalea porphyrae]
MSRTTSTLIGAIAILLWAFLALCTAASGTIPPFQLNAMAFAVGTLVGMAKWIKAPSSIKKLRQPLMAWALGVAGLFGYHFFYFTALRNAPPIDASLIGYLWPLLIVLFSALLPGEQLKWQHILGSILGLGGAVLIVTGGKGFTFNAEYGYGYFMAFLGALTWSSYSVLSRRFANVPTDAVTGFCAATAVLSLGCHLLWETTVWPQDLLQWSAVIGVGLGPLGLAFYVWDHGVKHGDIQIIGAASYATPLLSTFLLVGFGYAQFTWAIGAACLLITFGAVIASKDMILGRRSRAVNAN